MSFRLVAASHGFRFGVTFHDAVYFALAEKEGAELYTADEKTLAKASLKRMKHVGENV